MRRFPARAGVRSWPSWAATSSSSTSPRLGTTSTYGWGLRFWGSGSAQGPRRWAAHQWCPSSPFCGSGLGSPSSQPKKGALMARGLLGYQGVPSPLLAGGRRARQLRQGQPGPRLPQVRGGSRGPRSKPSRRVRQGVSVERSRTALRGLLGCVAVDGRC